MNNISRSSSSSSASSGYHFDPSMSANMHFTIPNDPSPNMRAFLAYIDALHRWDFEDTMACFDEMLEHRILPQSLGRPVLNKKQYREYFKAVHPIFKSWRATIHEVLECGDALSVHASAKGESIHGTIYEQEYSLMIHYAPQIDPDVLPKMTMVKEFVDSSVSVRFYAEEKERVARLKLNAEGRKRK